MSPSSMSDEHAPATLTVTFFTIPVTSHSAHPAGHYTHSLSPAPYLARPMLPSQVEEYTLRRLEDPLLGLALNEKA